MRTRAWYKVEFSSPHFCSLALSVFRNVNVINVASSKCSIGSLGKHGSNDTVENVLVSDVVFIKSTNGARIKTWQVGVTVLI